MIVVLAMPGAAGMADSRAHAWPTVPYPNFESTYDLCSR
jgi:hypothetical protein